MFSRPKIFILILVLMMVFLSACGSDQVVSPADPGGDGEQQESDQINKGVGLVHYHYLVKHPDAEWTVEPLILVDVEPGSSPGSYKVSGMTEVDVQMSMGADKETDRCKWRCDIILKFIAEGEITLDENTGKCIIPMRITFTPQEDQWILESDCPSELQTTLNCATLSVHMLDPSVYTFEANRRDVTIPTDKEVTLRAELKNFTMPPELEEVCDW